MNLLKTVIFFLIVMIISYSSYAFKSGSENYEISTGTVSSGGDIINSNSYKNYVATGVIAGTVDSTTYKNWLGFFYTWLLADGEVCTNSDQCEGSFCCSNTCSSNSCPVAAASTSTGGGGDSGGSAGTGGGGAGFFAPLKDYSLNIDSIRIKLALGESTQRELIVENTGRSELTVAIGTEGVEDYFSLFCLPTSFCFSSSNPSCFCFSSDIFSSSNVSCLFFLFLVLL